MWFNCMVGWLHRPVCLCVCTWVLCVSIIATKSYSQSQGLFLQLCSLPSISECVIIQYYIVFIGMVFVNVFILRSVCYLTVYFICRFVLIHWFSRHAFLVKGLHSMVKMLLGTHTHHTWMPGFKVPDVFYFSAFC